ncbi:diaminopimelate decarboxylase [Rhodopirellula sp. MGV]|uniref:diaminopimelate decarboxylase n=1 Tax=Rhodopirellula sp. MGV TaxID=2023130 RepID=UPI000B96DC41|nr:diaminopimelate decarboxylase [Rhodopirellula sp. MGV]OYP36800.1 diaminopimelate decarboxylase [Rhodopirellula sp. MGV]PNY36492.1 diaminopimelate decarboxylase [Rhodopirellula baltica]
MTTLATPSFSTSRHQIAGQSVSELAKKFGTPLYVYDLAVIEQRIADLAKFDVVRYAQKACSNLAILDRMRRKNVVVDAVSAGEIYRALAAGYSAENHGIVYTADIFDSAALELVLEHNIHVNCGSPDMIAQLGERRPGAEVTLRINPGFGHGHSQKTNTGGEQSKHGIWHSQIDECLRLADQFGVTITGLHMHIGSGTDLEHLSEVCDAMRRTAMEVGRTVKTISAGGGLPVPYNASETYVDLNKYFELWDTARNQLAESFGHAISLEIEPGRYLSAEAGSLIAEVRSVKKVGDNLFFLLDAGFNDLARPVMYGAYHPISVCGADGNSVSDRETVDAVIGGPLCESGDIFTQREGGFVDQRNLPMCRVGDYVILENAGAYGFVMASNYNSKLRAAEVLIEDGEAKLIRKRETFEDLTRSEIIPQ